MARLNQKRPSTGDNEDAYEARRTAASRRLTPNRLDDDEENVSPSPAASFSSDKENRHSRDKSAATPSTPSAAARRIALADRSSSGAGPSRRTEQDEDHEDEAQEKSILDTRVYDPEQDMDTRRTTRKSMRDLTRELLDSKNEFLARESTGLKDSILKADAYFATVKQTSDATLDSRFLVSAGDTAARRAVRMNFGGASRGIDVREFVLKCRGFMNRGPREDELSTYPASIHSTLQSKAHHQTQIHDGSSDDEGADPHDDGDELNWAWLGIKACAPYSTRPPTPSFLLGPLAVQKKIRAHTQRTQRERPRDPADAVRPDELQAGDAQQKDNANLTALCRRIFKQLLNYQQTQTQSLEEWATHYAETHEIEADAIPEDEMGRQLESRQLRSDGGVCLFRFAFNPRSFGQTVENLFYISFLIRDGKAGLGQSPEGLPSVHPTDPSDPDAARAKKVTRQQAVFHLDFETWKAACEEFGVEECVIGHREDDRTAQIGDRGWYA